MAQSRQAAKASHSLFNAIVKNHAIPTRFSESPSRMTNDKCSMTNSQFRLIPLVAALPLWEIRGPIPVGAGRRAGFWLFLRKINGSAYP
jgi:hypothetical protein